jgi:hypothetical protein
MLKFAEFVNESNPGGRFPHQLKNERYWRSVVYGDRYLTAVLDTVFQKQNGFASDRQFQVLKRKELGITTPYHTKN